MEKRQEQVLKCLIREYIRNAKPVSSQMLFEKYHLSISPATIRWEMVELTENGYLYQPYASAGRVPTEKAYRFFIEKFCEPRLSPTLEQKIEEIFQEKDEREILRAVGKLMSLASKNISILFFEGELFWQGLSYLLSQPEFNDPKQGLRVVRTFEELYQSIYNNDDEIKSEIKVYIGRENPFGEDDNLSLVVGGLEDGLVGILGPTRMDYQKNIALVKKVKEVLEEIK